jgi:hypothetical protein
VSNKQLFNKYILNNLFTNIESGEKNLNNTIFKNFNKIFIIQKNLENDEFFIAVINKFSKIEENFYKISDWRIQKEVISAFYNVFECFYKNFSTGEDFSQKLTNFLTKNIFSDNYQIQCEGLKLLSKKLKFCRNKEEVVKFTEFEILASKSFYKRRLYFTFFEFCLQIFSSKFLKEIGVMDNLFKFFDDKNLIHVSNLISILKNFYPIFNDDSRIKFKILTKVEDIAKNLSAGLIKDKEIEIVNLF